MKKSIYFLSVIAIFLLLRPNVFSKVSGSPGAKTGSPMDGNNCTACHNDGTINTGSGILSVATNIPVQGYTAGQTYSIIVDMNQSSISRFGFEITCEEGNLGAKTGAFGITDPSTKFVNNNKAVTHVQGGTLGSGFKTWSMNWTAPQTGVSAGVIFYVSAIAANNNTTNSGDQVYTTSRSFAEATTSVSEKQNKITAFVNPISKDIMINAVEPIYISNLEVYDISAKLVYSKKEVLLPSVINVDFLNSGIYILNMQTRGEEMITKKVIIP